MSSHEKAGLLTVTQSAGLSAVDHTWAAVSDALDAGDSPKVALYGLRALHKRFDEASVLAVRQARAQGYTWQQIGDLLGVTRSAAHQRFSKLV